MTLFRYLPEQQALIIILSNDYVLLEGNNLIRNPLVQALTEAMVEVE